MGLEGTRKNRGFGDLIFNFDRPKGNRGFWVSILGKIQIN